MTLEEFLRPEREAYERTLKKGMEKGMEKGIEKGRQEKIEMAKAFLLKGVDMDIVASVTKLAKVQLKKILN